jgi:tetratricopeptide (TPR) repeat protein
MFEFRRSKVHLPRAAIIAALILLSGCSSPEERAQNYYERGKELLSAKEPRRAEIEFRNAVKYNKKLLPAWQSLAQVDEQLHKWGDLIPDLRGILELSPNDMASRIKLGKLLLISGSVDDALRLVNDDKADKGNADLMALRAAILYRLNDTEGAVREAQAALKVDPDNTSAMFVLAGNDYAHGDTSAALEILNNPAMTRRDDIGTQIFRVQVFEKAQDLPHAEALLQKLTNLYPQEMAFKKELVRLYLIQKRGDDAEKEQRAIVATDPKNVSNQLDLIRLLNTTKGPAAAQQELESLISAGGDIFPYQIALAQLEFTQGKFPDAAALLNKIIDGGSPSDHVITAQLNLAEMELRQKQTDAAAALVADVLKKDGRNTGGLAPRASIRMDHGEFDGAISDLRQALNDQPRATNLMLLLASAYERSGSIDLAEKEFADAMKASNFDPAVSLNYVAFLERRNSVARAEDVLTDLATRWPNNIQVLSALAQVRLTRGEWVGAQQVADAIKRLSANNVVGDELLGAALAGQSKFAQSIEAFQNAYAAAPVTQPMYGLVAAYITAGKPDQAIAFLQSVLKANPSNAAAYVLLGSVQLANKAPDQARQSFLNAIKQQPKDDAGYKALAELYVAQNNNDEALKTVQSGLKEVPDSFALQMTLAGLLERTGDYEGAISSYQRLHDKDPSSIVVSNNLASLLADYRTDKPSLDEAQALAASLQKSSVPQFKDTLGWVDYRQGNYQAALPLLQSAAEKLPKLALVRYHLGMTYAAMGQTGKAAEQFKMALSQAPDQELEQKIHAALVKTSTQ